MRSCPDDPATLQDVAKDEGWHWCDKRGSDRRDCSNVGASAPVVHRKFVQKIPREDAISPRSRIFEYSNNSKWSTWPIIRTAAIDSHERRSGRVEQPPTLARIVSLRYHPRSSLLPLLSPPSRLLGNYPGCIRTSINRSRVVGERSSVQRRWNVGMNN
jgi:hypothetical protein